MTMGSSWTATSRAERCLISCMYRASQKEAIENAMKPRQSIPMS